MCILFAFCVTRKNVSATALRRACHRHTCEHSVHVIYICVGGGSCGIDRRRPLVRRRMGHNVTQDMFVRSLRRAEMSIMFFRSRHNLILFTFLGDQRRAMARSGNEKQATSEKQRQLMACGWRTDAQSDVSAAENIAAPLPLFSTSRQNARFLLRRLWRSEHVIDSNRIHMYTRDVRYRHYVIARAV